MVLNHLVVRQKLQRKKLALSVENKYPEVSKFLRDGFYVDDGAESKAYKEDLVALMKNTDSSFSSIGCQIKAWTVSESTPSDKVSKDGCSIDVGAMLWFPQFFF